MGTFLFLFIMAICTGMVVYGVTTFTIRLRRQRRRRAMASTRLDPTDIAVMAQTTAAPPRADDTADETAAAAPTSSETR